MFSFTWICRRISIIGSVSTATMALILFALPSLAVDVERKAPPVLASAIIEAPGSVLMGQEIRLQIRLLNLKGELILDTKQPLPVILSDDYLCARPDPQDTTGRFLLLRGLKPGLGILTLKYKNEKGEEIKSTIGIRVVSGKAHQPLRISLDLVDDQTAAQLFGARTSKEFYVVRVRLFNNLDQSGPEFLGSSLLVYGESIEAAVVLQKRYDPRSKTKRTGNGVPSKEWKKVEWGDVEGNSAQSGSPHDKAAPGGERSDGDPSEKVLAPPTAPEDQDKLPCARHHFRSQPYSFEMMINSINTRDEKDPRTQIFTYAHALATIASFFTLTNLRHGEPSANLINGFSNILIPGFERLYPDRKDTLRQNFVSMSMKPLEEIPFGADIARVLFFPRHSFHGVIPGYEVRIGEIIASEVNVKVAIVDKTKAFTANAAAP